jgi:hypothetical protein
MTMRGIAVLALGALLGVLGLVFQATGASAAEKVSPLPQHFPLYQEICFGRTYDAKHLASHPKQRVTSIHLFRDFTPDTNSELPPDDKKSLMEPDGDDGRVNLSAYVRLRDKKGVYSNMFSCTKSEKGDVLCGIDCDGGSFRLKTAGTALDLSNEGFVVVGGCGGNEEDHANSVFVQPGQDDKSFRLAPQPLNACIAEREAMKPAFAALGKPIRERLATLETRCFARSYDTAHLASHPKQLIKRISMIKPKEEPKKPDDDYPSHKLTFKIERRDGQKFEKTAECSPDSYIYSCTSPEEANGSHEFYLARAGDSDIVLRDPRKVLESLFGANLGADDKSFKLTQSDDSACRF